MDKRAELDKLKNDVEVALEAKDFKTANEKGKARYELAKDLHKKGIKLEIPTKKSK